MACGTTESVKDSRGHFGRKPILHVKPRLSLFEDVIMKTCFKCLQEKPISEFYAHKMMADGHLSKCKDCAIKDATGYRNANIEKARQYDRDRSKTPHRMKDHHIRADKYKKQYPFKRKAHAQISNALRYGFITKPNICSVCGVEKRIYGHHEDYSKPLEVVWVCQPCHYQIHAKKKELIGIDVVII